MTSSQSIVGGDSGELVSEGCTLGIPHPPGYPLYTVIVFLAVRIGKYVNSNLAPVFWVNLTSCLFGSLSSGILALSLFDVLNQTFDKTTVQLRPVTRAFHKSNEKSRNNSSDSMSLKALVSVTVGLLHAFSPLAWVYHVTAEVFALHNFFVALIIHASVQLSFLKDSSSLYGGAFICGLAMTNQHTSILLSIPMVCWVFYVIRMTMEILFTAAFFFLSGIIMMYSYMYTIARMYPHPGSWGDISTFSGLVNHIQRKDYGTFQLYSGNDNGAEGMILRCYYWAEDFMFHQTVPIVGFAFLVGCFVLWNDVHLEQRNNNKITVTKRVREPSVGLKVVQVGVGAALFFSLCFYLVVFHSLSNLPLHVPLYFGIHQRFWMQPNMIAFFISGIGMNHVLQNGFRKFSKFIVIFHVIPLILIGKVFFTSFPIADQSENAFFSSYARSILKSLPESSLLLINYDQQWTSVRYLQECENIRPDVISINLSMMSYPWWGTKHDLYPKLVFPGPHYSKSSGFSFKDFVDANYHRLNGNIFLGGDLPHPEPQFLNKYVEIPHGIVRKLQRSELNEKADAKEYRNDSLMIWENISGEFAKGLPDPRLYGADTWESTIVIEFFRHMISRSVHLLDVATVSFDESSPNILQCIVEAIAWLEIGRINSDIPTSSSMLKNLGLGYMYMVRSKVRIFPKIRIPFKTIIEHQSNILFENIWYNDTRRDDWKTWASLRWKDCWNDFLNHEDAKYDESYFQVKTIFETVTNMTVR